MSEQGWEGWDLDGTISVYTPGDYNAFVVGPPIPRTINILKRHLAEGKTCKIFTARVNPKTETPERLEKVKSVIQAFLRENVGQELELTCEKDYHMYRLYDDRAVQVYPNTGETLESRIEVLETKLRKEQDMVSRYQFPDMTGR